MLNESDSSINQNEDSKTSESDIEHKLKLLQLQCDQKDKMLNLQVEQATKTSISLSEAQTKCEYYLSKLKSFEQQYLELSDENDNLNEKIEKLELSLNKMGTTNAKSKDWQVSSEHRKIIFDFYPKSDSKVFDEAKKQKHPWLTQLILNNLDSITSEKYLELKEVLSKGIGPNIEKLEMHSWSPDSHFLNFNQVLSLAQFAEETLYLSYMKLDLEDINRIIEE